MPGSDAGRPLPFGGQVMTVTGPANPDGLQVVDAHNHVWIDALPGVASGSPHLTDRVALLAEMRDFCEAGGSAIVDCQPGGCGRNGRKLQELSQASQVAIIASTGFHRALYYPADWWLWEATPGEIVRYFSEEIQHGLYETRNLSEPVRAGLIKCACESTVRDTPQAPLEAAAQTAADLGVCVEVHTEKGADAEVILDFFTARGVEAAQLVLCHMDKRPDHGLHRALARAGAMLEYDTFYRPKYEPETRAWPLVEFMLADGLEGSVALATDMAEASMWKRLGGGPGLTGFLTIIRSRLESMGAASDAIQRLTGGNIARRLAGAG